MNKIISIVTVSFTVMVIGCGEKPQPKPEPPVKKEPQVVYKSNYVRPTYTTKNGVIYKDHPLVSKVRLLMQAYLTKDVDEIKSHYTASTAFYDVMNSGLNEYKTLDEEFADFNTYMEVFDLLEINESGYPDVLDYEGDGSVVISWWNMKFKNKKSGNTTTIKQHIQHAFNEKGEISREDYYFNPAQLPD